jgi:hypothetical protein
LIGAAEKAGASVVAYGPLGSETVDLAVKIFTRRLGVTVKNWRAANVIQESNQDLNKINRREAREPSRQKLMKKNSAVRDKLFE